MNYQPPTVRPATIDESNAYHAQDNSGVAGEPDEWQTSPQLHTSPIVSIALCKYTGERVGLGGPCVARMEHRHRDHDCTMLYHSEEGLRQGDVIVEMVAPAVRSDGGDVTFVDPVA